MYLAGIVADGSQMSKAQLEAWAKGRTWHMLAEYTVPGVATESPYVRICAEVDKKQEGIGRIERLVYVRRDRCDAAG